MKNRLTSVRPPAQVTTVRNVIRFNDSAGAQQHFTAAGFLRHSFIPPISRDNYILDCDTMTEQNMVLLRPLFCNLVKFCLKG
jgi:hypothetical protein